MSLLTTINQPWIQLKKNYTVMDSIYFQKSLSEKLNFIKFSFKDWNFIILDTETTDLNEFGTALPLQISIKIVENWEVVQDINKFIFIDLETYYHTESSLKICHISPEDVKNKWQNPLEVRDEIIQVISSHKNKNIICHNAKFDKEIINNFLNYTNTPKEQSISNKFIDSLEFIKELKKYIFFLSQNKSITLDSSLNKRWNTLWNNQSCLLNCYISSGKTLDKFKAHDASEDTAMLLEIIKDMYKDACKLIDMNVQDKDLTIKINEIINNSTSKSIEEKFLSFFKLLLKTKYKILKMQKLLADKYKEIVPSKDYCWTDKFYIQRVKAYEKDSLPKDYIEFDKKIDYSIKKGREIDIYDKGYESIDYIQESFEYFFQEQLNENINDEFETELITLKRKNVLLLEVLKKLRELIIQSSERLDLIDWILTVEQVQKENIFKKKINYSKIITDINSKELTSEKFRKIDNDYYIINLI